MERLHEHKISLPELVKSVGEAGADIVTELINQILIKEVILAEWEISTILNCCKGRRGTLERGDMGRGCYR